MTAQLALPSCVLPGCRNPVGQVGEPCGECLRAFGPILRQNPNAPPLTAEEIAERDSYVDCAYALQRMIREGR
ncbi:MULTISPECIES: hypothetical protein [Mycobacterium]|uniref:Uncharacterized protein n=2 Tax=Mycobacterium TaxID=1763 RepID=A0A2G5PQN2_MYCCE|nr:MULTISPECIES: hypothetical protein [Mycobacterium]MCV7232787.1 hypothetical protein [Mycobacterium branderi]ORA40923.1 hypothetical protein BST20_01885 [Mycobacterium branderi]PIB80540.1 hypothetical protein CQY23_03095 [Mycobacterium celatum]BBZ09817.1 hypothetical protein MBRA_00120 [Mycobacterium branderi]BBZ09888.1 hypothetical protein MBRA_00830 [Mycobacterium branderi]